MRTNSTHDPVWRPEVVHQSVYTMPTASFGRSIMATVIAVLVVSVFTMAWQMTSWCALACKPMPQCVLVPGHACLSPSMCLCAGVSVCPGMCVRSLVEATGLCLHAGKGSVEYCGKCLDVGVLRRHTQQHTVELHDLTTTTATSRACFLCRGR